MPFGALFYFDYLGVKHLILILAIFPNLWYYNNAEGKDLQGGTEGQLAVRLKAGRE